MTSLQPLALAQTETARSDLIDRAVSTALAGLASTSRRVYSAHIARYLAWCDRSRLDRELVKHYVRSLETNGASAQVRNQALAALKRLAIESADLGWIEQSTAAQISTIKSRKTQGIRAGRWLETAQVVSLFETCDRSTLQGRRDAAVFALLIGCGLRRSEACGLETAQLIAEHGRMVITNLIGKGGRIRSIAVPEWAAQLIEEWEREIAQ